MTYLDWCYLILKSDMDGMDAVYEEHIVNLLGLAGLTELRSNGLLEPCGVLHGRQLYALCDK